MTIKMIGRFDYFIILSWLKTSDQKVILNLHKLVKMENFAILWYFTCTLMQMEINMIVKHRKLYGLTRLKFPHQGMSQITNNFFCVNRTGFFRWCETKISYRFEREKNPKHLSDINPMMLFVQMLGYCGVRDLYPNYSIIVSATELLI